MAYEIYREEIADYSAREPDLTPPRPHFYVHVWDPRGEDHGVLRVDVSAYSGALSFSVEEPEEDLRQETVTVSPESLTEALAALQRENAAARAAEQANEPRERETPF